MRIYGELFAGGKVRGKGPCIICGDKIAPQSRYVIVAHPTIDGAIAKAHVKCAGS